MRLTFPQQHVVRHAIINIANILDFKPTTLLRRGREHALFAQKMRQWLSDTYGPKHVTYFTVCEAVYDLQDKYEVTFKEYGYIWRGKYYHVGPANENPQPSQAGGSSQQGDDK